MDQVTTNPARVINTSPGVVVPRGAQTVILEIMTTAGMTSCWATSAARNPWNQARVMYDNCRMHGPSAQDKLYLAPGREVIGVYKAEITSGWAGDGEARDHVIEAMEKKIIEVGPQAVSHHCLPDDAPIWVIDFDPDLMQGKTREFIAAAKSHPRISLVLEPPKDPAVHLEIKKLEIAN